MKSTTSTFIVAALGYFVDIYDLILFGVVRIESLKAIGIDSEHLLNSGMFLINCQMGGMLLGGIFWGIVGDKKGRTTVMMASILVYSLANIANAFVYSFDTYVILRFIAGFGLSGEVGLAVTLISESVPKQQRTLWITALTAFGLMGAVTAGLVGDILHWRLAYCMGGVMGLVLLFLRFRVTESLMFFRTLPTDRGRIDLFVRFPKRLLCYLACILVGVPIWYVTCILMTFSPELMKSQGMQEIVSAGDSILFCYLGLFSGDILSGLISHHIQSRRIVIGVFLFFASCTISYFLHSSGFSLTQFYCLCFLLGFSVGYCAVYVTMVAESFGTNIRATALVTVTNWMRGSALFFTAGIQYLQNYMSLPQSAFVIAVVVLFMASLSLIYLSETFGQDLNYRETC